MNECNHEWEAVKIEHAFGGYAYQDECKHCGCIAYLDFESGERKAKPLAKVISLCDYRKKREIEDAVGTSQPSKMEK